MWVVLFTVAVVLALAALFVYSLRRRRPAENWPARMAAEGAPVILAELRDRVEMLGALPALFRDGDYRWLREHGQLEAARLLRRDRVRLARRYLLELRRTFDRIHSLHEFVAPPGASDLAAAAALRFRLRWTVARLLLPLSYRRLHLTGLAPLGQELAGMLAALDRQAIPAPA